MKGINFTEPMFRKVVSGEKTQTRRIINPQPDEGIEIPEEGFVYFDGEYCIGRQRYWDCKYDDVDFYFVALYVKPPYKPGETLYLKEPYAVLDDMILYRYGSDGETTVDTWQNKLFMPERHARHYIKIKNVRVERLQDIRNEDCLKEGVGFKDVYEKIWSEKPTRMYFNYSFEDYERWLVDTPVQSYSTLIDKISGKGTWDSNPFVWVYEFELISKNNE